MRSRCKAFSILLINKRGPSPLLMVILLACWSWVLLESWVRKSVDETITSSWSLHQYLPPNSCHVSVLVLTSFDDEQKYGIVNQRNSFLPNLFSIMVFHCIMSNPNKTVGYIPLYEIIMGSIITHTSAKYSSLNSVHVTGKIWVSVIQSQRFWTEMTLAPVTLSRRHLISGNKESPIHKTSLSG